MASSSVVGALRVVLSADAAEFSSAMGKAAAASDAAARDITKAGASFAALEPRMASVTRLVRDFSGSLERRSAEEFALAIDKIGGAARLSEGELRRAQGVFSDFISKAKAMGTEIPPHIAKVSAEIDKLSPAATKASGAAGILQGQWSKLTAAFGAGVLIDRAAASIVRLGFEAIQAASEIVDLSNKTGLSTDAIQLYGAVAKQTGGDIQTYADAIFKLGINIEKGGKEVEAAAAKLGISYKELRTLAPEAQFELIAQRLHDTTSAQERNTLGVELFGRQWAAVAPGVVDGIQKIKEQTIIASNASILALDAASDALDRFQENTKNAIASFLGGIVLAVERASEGGEKLKQTLGLILGGGTTMGSLAAVVQGSQAYATLEKEITKTGKSAADAAPEIKELTDKIRVGTKVVSESEQQYRRWSDTVTGAALEREVDQLAENFLRLAREGKVTASVVEATWKQLGPLVEKGAKLPPILQLVNSEFVRFNTTGKSFFETFGKGSKAIETFTVDFIDFVDVGKSFFDTFGPLPKVVETFTIGAEESTDANKGWSLSLEDAASALFTVSDAAQQLGRALGGETGQIVGTIGAITEGLGRLAAGDVIGGLTQLVGLLGQFKTLGRNIARDMQDAFATTDLGFENLNSLMQHLRDLGATDLVSAGDRAQRKDDEAATRRWMEDVRKFLDEIDRRAAMAFDQLTKAAQDFGGKAPAALQPFIQELLKANALTAEQRALLEGLAGAPEWEQLQSIAQKYGIELGALGQEFQNARIGDIALQYARDFMTLRDAGGDVNGLLIGMQDEVQALVNDALKFGTAMPEALRPVLEGLLQMGLLTDENGNKLEDLSRFSFTGTLEDAFKDMKSILEEIRDLLAGGLPNAARSGGQEVEREFTGLLDRIRNQFKGMKVNVPVEFDVGAFSPPSGFAVPGAAQGGVVTRPTLLMAGERGAEAIIPLDDASLGTQRIDNHLYIDGREVTVSVVRHLREEARRQGVRPI